MTGMVCECGSHAWKPIGKGFVTTVSPEKLDYLTPAVHAAASYRRFYARYSGGLYLHRALAGQDGKYVDHINGNSLDNTDENLRPCSPAQNQANMRRFSGASGFKGVSKSKTRWKAKICVARKYIWIGRFDTEVEAAMAYDEAAVHHFGDYALTNKQAGLY